MIPTTTMGTQMQTNNERWLAKMRLLCDKDPKSLLSGVRATLFNANNAALGELQTAVEKASAET